MAVSLSLLKIYTCFRRTTQQTCKTHVNWNCFCIVKDTMLFREFTQYVALSASLCTRDWKSYLFNLAVSWNQVLALLRNQLYIIFCSCSCKKVTQLVSAHHTCSYVVAAKCKVWQKLLTKAYVNCKCSRPVYKACMTCVKSHKWTPHMTYVKPSQCIAWFM